MREGRQAVILTRAGEEKYLWGGELGGNLNEVR